MRASGNGAADVCANNLLRMVRGEVPFERVKGLDPRLIDRPAASALVDIEQDAEWLIETYEPRGTFQGVEIAQPEGKGGSFIITAKVTEKEA